MAVKRLVLLWNLLLWLNLTKGGIPEISLLLIPFTMAQPPKGRISLILKKFTMVQPNKRWHPTDLLLMWNLLLSFNLATGGIPEISPIVKPLLWINLSKWGIPEISLIVKPFFVVQPHKRWHPRDQSYRETCDYGSTSQKVSFRRLVLLWNIFRWLKLTKDCIPDISLTVKPLTMIQPQKSVISEIDVILKPFTMAQAYKRWHPRY